MSSNFKHRPIQWNVSNTHTLSLIPVSRGSCLMNCKPGCFRSAEEHCTCVHVPLLLGNLEHQITWLLLSVWRCIFLPLLLQPLFFSLLTGEMQVCRSLPAQVWKLWTPGFSLLEYLWIYLRVPHSLPRLQHWTFPMIRELLRPRWSNQGQGSRKSSMSARFRWLSWNCGCTKSTCHLSRKH